MFEEGAMRARVRGGDGDEMVSERGVLSDERGGTRGEGVLEEAEVARFEGFWFAGGADGVRGAFIKDEFSFVA